MKTILSLAFLILLASSCKKERLESQLYGTWEIRTSVHHEPGITTVSYQPGNGTYIELKTNGTINRYKNATQQSSETYKIVKKKITKCSWGSQKDYLAIEYESEYHEQIDVDGDMLKISTPPCLMDGGSQTYVRINK